ESAGDRSPPTTVITQVRQAREKWVIRGTSAEDDAVRKVIVNGTEAKAVSPTFTEWEATVDPPPDGRLSAHAVDRAGNAEPRPHVVRVDGVGVRAVINPVETPKADELKPPAKPGGDPKGLLGEWRVESQRRAGRPVEHLSKVTVTVERDRL